MYIYHALINTLSTHMIHINLNMIFYTHVEHCDTKTIYINLHYKYTITLHFIVQMYLLWTRKIYLIWLYYYYKL